MLSSQVKLNSDYNKQQQFVLTQHGMNKMQGVAMLPVICMKQPVLKQSVPMQQQHIPKQSVPMQQDVPAQKQDVPTQIASIQQQQQDVPKTKILIAGTSLNRKLHRQVIKNVTDSDVNFVNQYQYTFYSEKNFLNVVPEEFKKEEYQVLVLSCDHNEISNMNTTLNCRENIEEWRNRVGQSSVKMFQLAEWCHQRYPFLKSVVFVKHLDMMTG